MGFRFRKSCGRGPFRVNLGKKGLGWSFGLRGFRFGVGSDGKPYFSIGLPGTGISYREKLGNSKKKN